ncbi:MAG: hypothetical protein IKF80_07760 [Erysipelotrichaceae bacterium]|nr:hypothetical protein [Erysipelotrichaceae bacterium]
MEKENREIKVTIRFTASEMDRITAMLQDRNSGKSTAGDSMTEGIKELSLSEFFREKILILNRSLELKKIRLELAEINTRLGQIEIYLSRKGAKVDETFTSEILGDFQKRIKALMLRMEEENGSYGSEEH